MSSFTEMLNQLPSAESSLLRRFARLIQPNDRTELEQLAQKARLVTRRNFGRTMRMFAPLYLSNECINNCRYCGFSRDNPILRVTLTVEQVEREARHLAEQGFRHVLLVAGEHPKFLRFDAALVLYPPVVLSFLGLGAAALISGLLAG